MSYRKQHSLHRRRAFTLIELLLVISIIGILSALGVSVLASAEQDALESRSKAGIERLSLVMNRKMEENRYRILPVRLPTDSTPLAIRTFRQQLMSEFARVEFPFRLQHLSSPFPSNPGPSGGPTPFGALNINRPQIADRYAAKLGIGSANPATVEHESAEVLYAILSLNFDEFGHPLSAVLREREIGDTDNDGYNEVLDAFGDPLQFSLRVRLTQDELDSLTAIGTDAIVRDALADVIGYEVILNEQQALVQGQVRGSGPDVAPWPMEKYRFTIRSVNLFNTDSGAVVTQ